MEGHGPVSRHPEADLLNSLPDEQAEAIEEVLQAAADYEPPVSVIRDMHERMKQAAAEGQRQREAREEKR